MYLITESKVKYIVKINHGWQIYWAHTVASPQCTKSQVPFLFLWFLCNLPCCSTNHSSTSMYCVNWLWTLRGQNKPTQEKVNRVHLLTMMNMIDGLPCCYMQSQKPGSVLLLRIPNPLHVFRWSTWHMFPSHLFQLSCPHTLKISSTINPVSRHQYFRLCFQQKISRFLPKPGLFKEVI